MDWFAIVVIVGVVAFIAGWHLMPRPAWMTELIDWYHNPSKYLKAAEVNAKKAIQNEWNGVFYRPDEAMVNPSAATTSAVVMTGNMAETSVTVPSGTPIPPEVKVE